MRFRERSKGNTKQRHHTSSSYPFEKTVIFPSKDFLLGFRKGHTQLYEAIKGLPNLQLSMLERLPRLHTSTHTIFFGAGSSEKCMLPCFHVFLFVEIAVYIGCIKRQRTGHASNLSRAYDNLCSLLTYCCVSLPWETKKEEK